MRLHARGGLRTSPVDSCHYACISGVIVGVDHSALGTVQYVNDAFLQISGTLKMRFKYDFVRSLQKGCRVCNVVTRMPIFVHA
jgi:hypothetical protein